MRVQSVNLNLIPTGVMPIVHLSQYDRDTDGALLFNIFNGPTPFNLTGCTATINGTKPDGNVYTYPCTVHSNFLTSAVYDQMTTVQGTHEAEIRISDGDSVVGTLNFQMAIEKAGVSEIDVSHTDVPTLLENIQASVDEAEYWAEQAAGAVAGVASFNGRHGSVLPVAGDYDASQISYGDRTVEDALDGMGGHTILNASGQEMPQRKNLRFAGANLSDDAQNDTTNVTITGGSGGSTITVTTIETTLYGETVTITDGTSTFTGVFDSSGVCVIDGVTATGTLTITSGAATNQLNVPYYGNYTTFLSFWAATINVTTDPGINSAIVKKDGVQIGTVNFTSGSGTYIAGSTGAYTFEVTVGGVVFSSPTVNVTEQTAYSTTIDIFSATLNISTSASSLYGKTITIKKGSTVVGTTVFSAQGSASYTVHETGTYTCECEGYSGSATVSAETTYNVTINAGLDLSAWIAAGSTTDYPLNPSSYADFSALEADEAAIRQLMTVHASVDYLAQATAGDSLMQSVINSDVCAKWINLSDYALDTLYANSDIADVMDTADKYGYGEWALVGQVPTLSSDTSDVIASSGSADNPYKAFDNDNSTEWVAKANITNAYLGYHFSTPIVVKEITFNTHNNNAASSVTSFKLQGSNTGNDWNDVESFTIDARTSAQNRYGSVKTDNTTAYSYWRIISPDVLYTSGGYGLGFKSLQFYTWGVKGNVPIMTANNAPYGVASAYQVFDGNASTSASGTDFSYQSVNPICVKKFECSVNGGTLQGSNDGSTYTNISDPSSNTTYYMYHRVHFASSQTVHTLQFYGRELTVKQASAPTDGREYIQIGSNYYTEDWGEKEFAQGSTRKTIYDHGVEPSGTITGGTKNPDCLTLSAVGTATVTIDKGTRTYMGGKAGLHASGTNRLKCGSGYSAFTASNMPDSNGFDISSISGSVAVGIEQTASGTFDCTEIWIE